MSIITALDIQTDDASMAVYISIGAIIALAIGCFLFYLVRRR